MWKNSLKLNNGLLNKNRWGFKNNQKQLFFSKFKHNLRCISSTSYVQSQQNDSKTDTKQLPDANSNTEKSKSESKELKNENKFISDAVRKYILLRRDYSKKYTENNTITAVRAMQEYFLKPEHLMELKLKSIRNPYRGQKAPIYVYLEQDVMKKAIEVWGSSAALKRKQKKFQILKASAKQHQFDEIYAQDEAFIHSPDQKSSQNVFTSGPGRVVIVASATNCVLLGFKFVCWLQTGSASMFSEFVHSVADTINQLLLLWGVHESMKTPDREHPYGFGNMRYITSLISGVGIFCMGCGATVYHGVVGLLQCHNQSAAGLTNFYSLSVLGIAALLESTALWVALRETRQNARIKNLSLLSYIRSGHDPSTNVVLLEDTCAVLGVGIAGVALVLTQHFNNCMYDYIGSICVGGLLGVIATFLVSSNINILIGKSISAQKLDFVQESLEDDAVIRGVYDVKATQVGVGEYKFKAEIDFDGREVTRAYLNTKNFDEIVNEFQKITTESDLESFMLVHGEQIIDTLGTQVDRIEGELKKQNPELKHIDLEVL